MKKLVYFCVLMFTFTEAQNIPNLGSVSDILWSKSDELNLGKATYDRLYRQGNIHNSQEDNDYLNYLGNKIGVYTNTRLGLVFYLTNSNSINAFATPGGYIGINAGLVTATENEHELAGVMAHEIAHVSQEHIARLTLATNNRQIANVAAMLAGVLVATAGNAGKAGASVISAVIAGEAQQQINNIRRYEVEADKTGRILMTKAGFSEKGMISFFARLKKSVSTNGVPSYLLTHPVPLERQAAIDNIANNKQVKLTSSDEYYLFRARIRAAFLNKDNIQNLINKERISVNAQIRDSTYYLSALSKVKQGKFYQALNELSAMQTKMRSKRDVILLKAKINLLSGKNERSEKIYKQLWKKYRYDSVVAYNYARFLMHKGKYKQAGQLLHKQVDNNVLNPSMYWLYGKILGKLGDKIKQNRLLIRFYQQSGDYKKALAQAQIAAKLPNISWQSLSMFEAKQKELKRIIDALEK